MKKIFLTAIAAILIPFISKAQWLGTNPVYFNAGNVGIGTTNPLELLHVAGTTRTNLLSLAESNEQLAYFGRGGSITGALSSIPNSLSLLYFSRDFAIGGWSKTTNTWQGVSFFINSDNGNVGIGTTSPGTKLHLQADANTSGAPDNAQFYITGNSAPGKRLSLAYNTSSNYGEIQSQAYSGGYTNLNLNPNGGNVGIGTTNPPTVGNYGVLAINGRSPSQGGYLSLMNNGTEVGSLAANSQLNIGAATGIVTQFYTGSTPTMQITAGGNMLLGKISQANASYLLDVNGKARCNEVVVNTTGADFVFQPGYKLNTLADIEKYVQANHHLPKIPSAQEMVTDGLKVGEMNKLLLMKVEELTLYLIAKDREVKGQQEEINQLKQLQTANQRQQKQIDDLKEQLEYLSEKIRKN